MIILLAISVSLDSLTIGIVFRMNKENILLGSIIFSTLSTISTTIALLLGQLINNKSKVLGSYIGTIIMIIIALKYLLL